MSGVWHHMLVILYRQMIYIEWTTSFDPMQQIPLCHPTSNYCSMFCRFFMHKYWEQKKKNTKHKIYECFAHDLFKMHQFQVLYSFVGIRIYEPFKIQHTYTVSTELCFTESTNAISYTCAVFDFLFDKI